MLNTENEALLEVKRKVASKCLLRLLEKINKN